MLAAGEKSIRKHYVLKVSKKKKKKKDVLEEEQLWGQ